MVSHAHSSVHLLLLLLGGKCALHIQFAHRSSRWMPCQHMSHKMTIVSNFKMTTSNLI